MHSINRQKTELRRCVASAFLCSRCTWVKASKCMLFHGKVVISVMSMCCCELSASCMQERQDNVQCDAFQHVRGCGCALAWCYQNITILSWYTCCLSCHWRPFQPPVCRLQHRASCCSGSVFTCRREEVAKEELKFLLWQRALQRTI